MIQSMTGFGRARETVDGRDISVEIKSVNSRYFDCSARISRSYSYLEERIKPYLQSRGIARGKVEVSISVEVLEDDSVEISIDEAYLAGYLNVLYRLRDEYGLKDDISVMSVARNPDLLHVKKQEEDAEREWARVLSVLEKATDTFLAVRCREGEKLAEDMRAKIGEIGTLVDEIETLSADDISGYREKLAKRLHDALKDNQISLDESRILTECAFHADRVAIDEELVRLRTHFGAFEQILASGEPVGRKLDFLMQEMNREINTAGSKCNNAPIARLVVEVKCLLEKIREQIQNLE